MKEMFSRLRDPNLDIYSISRELATFGRSAIVELIRLAQESAPPMNVKAAILVGIIGKGYIESVDCCIALLQRRDLIGEIALLNLKRFDEPASIPALEKLLDDSEDLVVCRAREAIEFIKLGLHHRCEDVTAAKLLFDMTWKQVEPNLLDEQREEEAIKTIKAHAFFSIAKAAYEEKRYSFARAASELAVELGASMPTHFDILGLSLIGLGLLEKAEAAFEQEVSLAPSLTIAHNNLGFVQALLNKRDAAIASFQSAIKIGAFNELPYLNLANLYQEKPQNLSSAESVLRAGIARFSSSAGCYNNLANLLRRLRRYEEAESYYRNAMRSDPSNKMVRRNFAEFLADRRRYKEAEAELRKVIREDPENAKAHLALGNLLGLRLNRYHEAVPAYYQAIKADPQLVPAYINLATILERYFCEFEKAERLREKVNELQEEGSRRKVSYQWGEWTHNTSPSSDD